MASLNYKILLSLILIIVYSSDFSEAALPVVLWHGMGDSCCNPFSMGRIKSMIRNEIPDIHVHSIRIGDNILADMEHGYYGNVNEQVKTVCEFLQEDPIFKDGYNAMGFSQGGQFLRAVAQRCPNPPMRNLISIGGQHQGVSYLPNCPGNPEESQMCLEITQILDEFAYESYIQEKLVQAQYWHDPIHEEVYKENSTFLAEINNEYVINENYKMNLNKLENFVMVKFTNDSMVVPQESEWFGFYSPEDLTQTVPLQDLQIYKEDRLGLRQMDEEGKLKFLEYDGEHLQFDNDWFIQEIIHQFLE